MGNSDNFAIRIGKEEFISRKFQAYILEWRKDESILEPESGQGYIYRWQDGTIWTLGSSPWRRPRRWRIEE